MSNFNDIIKAVPSTYFPIGHEEELLNVPYYPGAKLPKCVSNINNTHLLLQFNQAKCLISKEGKSIVANQEAFDMFCDPEGFWRDDKFIDEWEKWLYAFNVVPL